MSVEVRRDDFLESICTFFIPASLYDSPSLLGNALCSVRVLVISSQVLFILHPIADPRSNLFIPLQDSRWHEQGWLLGANLHLFHPCMTLLPEPWATLCGARVVESCTPPHKLLSIPSHISLYISSKLVFIISCIAMSVYRHVCITSCLYMVMSV